MTKAKLCFIGAGFHASTNIYPSVIEAGAEIKAISTRSIERSKTALQRFGSSGTPYDDYKKMLKQEKCDGVVVVAQPEDHPALVLDCIRAGKNVYVDKPLGMNEREAKEISDAAKQAGVKVMVGFMKRYAPCYMKLKELIEEGSLGSVRSFQARFAVDSTPFCKDEEQFMKLAAIHIVDLVRHLFGEVVHVTGFRNNHGEYISNSISLKFDNGTVGSLYFTGMTAWSRESENLLVTFDDGFAFVDEINSLTIHESQTFDELPWKSLKENDRVFTPSASPMSGAYRDLYLRGFVGEMAHFIECCTNDQEPLSSGSDNVKTMRLCDQILSSLM
ncbi:gfo/Idh/MocA family oxidoreductase [Priestia aryabhattai]|uniref:Gfo/Idh/MocA family protein n=1 Tax=Priestia TaxID=2800373 RepID=UPI00064EE263|nr:Gfo/Idh/MocA family oxidoreductase [Priestia aryabhattai]NLR46174.1 Gfo/Idh/MocA family oxidoreductase [Priestia megaterium]KML27861.1 dehydrogenase [Priestia aryabhattai]KMO02016.1 dehydrogenase [Priestia aryabhattai]KZE13367.1 dehydrogenase [Priestia aryabhattai]MBY0007877.1 Gfo/Idh/MocA family oxidoreductase [Priestia aryabhattai]